MIINEYQMSISSSERDRVRHEEIKPDAREDLEAGTYSTVILPEGAQDKSRLSIGRLPSSGSRCQGQSTSTLARCPFAFGRRAGSLSSALVSREYGRGAANRWRRFNTAPSRIAHLESGVRAHFPEA